MSDIKYEALGNCDLTPEQLDGMEMWDRDVTLAERHRAVGALLVRRAVAELRRRRAAEAAGADRVREVVREAAGHEMCSLDFVDAGIRSMVADAIANRVASQLTPTLSTEDFAGLRLLRGDAHTPVCDGPCSTCDPRRDAIALLDRLIGAVCPEHHREQDERDTLDADPRDP